MEGSFLPVGWSWIQSSLVTLDWKSTKEWAQLGNLDVKIRIGIESVPVWQSTLLTSSFWWFVAPAPNIPNWGPQLPHFVKFTMLLSLPRIHVALPSAFLLLPSPVRKQNSGGFNPFEKYDFVSWDDENPNIWKVIKTMFQSPPRTVLGSCPWSDKPRFPDSPIRGLQVGHAPFIPFPSSSTSRSFNSRLFSLRGSKLQEESLHPMQMASMARAANRKSCGSCRDTEEWNMGTWGHCYDTWLFYMV